MSQSSSTTKVLAFSSWARPNDASINGVALLTFQRNSEGVYALQKVQGPDIGVNFPASETSSLRADGRPVNDVQVIVAQVMR